MLQLEGKMKRILFLALVLFVISCDTKPTKSIDIPSFDFNKAFT